MTLCHDYLLLYRSDGPFQWRDSKTPSQILQEYTLSHHMDPPVYYGNIGIKVGHRQFSIHDFGRFYLLPATESTCSHMSFFYIIIQRVSMTHQLISMESL